MKKSIQLLATLTCFALVATSVHAALSYWDSNGAADGAGVTPNGTWGVSAFWNTAGDGTGTPGAWVSGDDAVFSAGSDATGTFTVTVSGTQTAGNLTVEEGTVTISGGDALNIGGSVAGKGIIEVYAGSTLTISSAVTGGDNSGSITAGVSASGHAGTLVLNGNNTFTGQINPRIGTLSFNSIGDVNAGASALGNPGTAALGTLKLGGTTDAVTLQYTGTGHSTDRVINLASSGSTCTITLDASGSGALVFTSAGSPGVAGVIATGGGIHVFQLGGTNTAENKITGPIVDNVSSSSKYTQLRKIGSGTWVLTGASTFYGVCDISEGTLIINSIGDKGVVSAIGTGNRNNASAGIGLGSGTATGTLKYVGPGQSSNRPFYLWGTTGGGAIDSSGTGPLVLSCSGGTGAFVNYNPSTGKTFTLKGTNTGANTFSGAISNGDSNTNKTSVTKDGSGKWVLSAVNSYTGATTVSGGTLLVNSPGSLAAGSSVTVASGATLGGDGTINGPVSVLAGGHLLPGASAGTLTLAGNLAFAATADSTFELSSSTSSGNDKVIMTGTSATLDGAGTTIIISPLTTLATADYVLFDLTGASGSVIGNFATTPGWAGTPPANASEYTVITSGKQVLLHWTCPTLPTAYSVTGGGAYCSGGSGVAVGLANSESGATYQLYRNGGATAVGTPVAADPGNPITFGYQTIADTYTVVATKSGGCTANMTGSAIVTVNALPTITLGANPAVCSGTTSADLTYSATTGTPDQYSIDFDATANAAGFVDVTLAALPASPITLAVPGGAAAATYNGTLTVRNSTTGCVSVSHAITVTVNAATAISVQPTNLTVCASSPAIFTVGATGTGLTYQWQVSGDAGVTFTNISETATNASFTNLVTAPTDNGNQYQVIVTGTCGLSVTSAPPAVLTVIAPPSGYSVTGGGPYCSGGPGVAVELANSESGVTYQLYRNGGATPVGTAVEADPGNPITFGYQTIADTYTVVATRTSGGCTANMPGSVTVTVTALPTITLGDNPAVCSGTTSADLTSSATTGTPDQYSIDFDDAANTAGFMDVTLEALPASPITITVPGAAAAATYNGTLTVRNSTTGCVSAGAAITVTVNAATAIGVHPTNLTVCASSPAIFTVGATGTGLTYQWQVSGDAGVTFTNISATATNASYTNLVTTPADNGNQYQVIVTGACGSPATSTPPALLTVAVPVLSIAQQDADVVISWTVTCLNYVLEKKGDIDPLTIWTPVTESVITVGDQNTVTVPVGSTNQFFRLRYP